MPMKCGQCRSNGNRIDGREPMTSQLSLGTNASVDLTFFFRILPVGAATATAKALRPFFDRSRGVRHMPSDISSVAANPPSSDEVGQESAWIGVGVLAALTGAMAAYVIWVLQGL